MNKDHLKIFLRVYAHRGFDWPAFHNKRSADEVRRDMQALEADIGQKLIEEAANGRVTKTDAARVFALIAQRIVNLMDAADEKFAVLDSENDTDVQLAATADNGGLLVSRALRAFEAQSTGVEVKHAIYSHSDVREKVLAGEAAIGLQYHASREAELNVVPVLNERVLPVCAPDHPLAGTRLDSYLSGHKGLINFYTQGVDSDNQLGNGSHISIWHRLRGYPVPSATQVKIHGAKE